MFEDSFSGKWGVFLFLLEVQNALSPPFHVFTTLQNGKMFDAETRHNYTCAMNYFLCEQSYWTMRQHLRENRACVGHETNKKTHTNSIHIILLICSIPWLGLDSVPVTRLELKMPLYCNFVFVHNSRKPHLKLLHCTNLHFKIPWLCLESAAKLKAWFTLDNSYRIVSYRRELVTWNKVVLLT